MDKSESSGYKDFVWAIELNRLSLELVGLWPKFDGIAKKNLGSNYRAAFICIMLTFVWGIPLVHALIRVWGNMTLMIDNLRITLPALMILLKYIIMQRKQSVILSIINMIREDWMSLNLIDAERNVMIKRSRTARLFVIYLNVLFILTLIVVSMLPWFGLSFRHVTNLTDQNRPLLLQTYYLYDTDKSPQFELTYLSQFISLLLAMIIYMSIDTFFVFVIFHVCGQLENFRRRLINLIPGKDFDKVLNNNVITHLKLIRYVNNIKNIFTLMILGSIMYFAIVFCLAGFVLLVEINTNEKINAENFLQICYMMVEIITLLLQMFFYCYAGELIIEQCETIYRTVYDLEWYKWKSKQARNLIIIMIRVQEPFRITAGNIVPLTMTTFCSLLKTSAGYISFLLTMQN
ncbi:Odorant receptor 067 [Nylanderia fulva]|uniref:Odorant receptor n=1 Tax=Nylanderia fulva TaxID=613905 RepID=A0A6G1LQH0_9HYME|nr:odorant receptor 49b-like [Nylanderia fulva]KAF3054313.1 Odorant receptor 067 [Nylanderia fulva]